MCGIAGIWRRVGPEPQDVVRIGRMAATLVHRGPDDFGFLLADTNRGQSAIGQNLDDSIMADLLLASRRLSILDLSPAGRQPITNEAGDVTIVFNGAIHNYIELRTELEALGHVFRSKTDTEVIVHAYEQWGADCARRFNGMWAYAIWDQRRRRLVLSRDRFGVKPLCIARHGDGLFFASEPKAIIAAGMPAVPNSNFVRQFLAYAVPIMGDETAFDGITQVPAAHNLIIDENGESQSRYWTYSDQSQSYDFSNPEQCFHDLFDDAVRLRLRSDVPIAILLSGGLDSSSIAVRAAKHVDQGQLEAFTASFPGYDVDEQRHAELVANNGGLPFNTVEYGKDDLLGNLRSVTWALDAPPAMKQTIARWRLLKAVSEKAPIVLDGQGGDEILGGYPYRYLKPYSYSELAALRPWNLYPRLWRAFEAYVERKRPWFGPSARKQQTTSKVENINLLAPDFPSARPVLGLPGGEPSFKHPSRLQSLLWRDHCFEIIPHVVHFADGISMAHSVESRPPFLDHRLVEFMYALPFDQMIRGTQTKYLLRRALAKDLPREICQRRDKMGLRPPTEDWVSAKKDVEILPTLMSDRARDRGIFNQQSVAECLRRADTDPVSNMLALRCYGLESWFRLFVDGEGFDAN
ncbi:MAG: asparagine synthase (glutamine-hydrolyzing) [Pseudomonadota bacterium]